MLCPRCGGIMDRSAVDRSAFGEEVRVTACRDCEFRTAPAYFRTVEPCPASPESFANSWRLEQERSERDDILRRLPFPVFGLEPRWAGLRWVNGWGTSGGNVRHLELTHADRRTRSRRLRIATLLFAPDDESAGIELPDLAQQLAQNLWFHGAPHALVRPTFTDDDPTATWSPLIVPVDGQPTMFRSLTHGNAWVALSPRAAEYLVTIEAEDIDPGGITLVTIDDLDPYRNDRPDAS